MAEFREQDSYINSDYDSDCSGESGSAPDIPPPLRNSITVQAESLVRGARAHPRPRGSQPPRVKYVLNRLEEFPEGGHGDARIAATFQAVRDLGVCLILGDQDRILPEHKVHTAPVPTRRILLDLSVVVALCCDSTHQPLPANDDELEARFRPLELSSDGKLDLAPHTNVSKDLRDQLDWEAQHPLVREMQERLSDALPTYGGELEFWVTEEVKNRLPGIVDVIGGKKEKARAKALFDGNGFWDGSRWQGQARHLEHIRARVLEEDDSGEVFIDRVDFTAFQRGLLGACQRMLGVAKHPSISDTPTPPATSRRSKNPKRTTTIFHASRLPSSHTLRTLIAGVTRGMTVLTNNRGAIGKVIREMGVSDGLPWEQKEDGQAVVWVVNPSSLSEWRRGEVEEQNKAVRLTSGRAGNVQCQRFESD